MLIVLLVTRRYLCILARSGFTSANAEPAPLRLSRPRGSRARLFKFGGSRGLWKRRKSPDRLTPFIVTSRAGWRDRGSRGQKRGSAICQRLISPNEQELVPLSHPFPASGRKSRGAGSSLDRGAAYALYHRRASLIDKFRAFITPRASILLARRGHPIPEYDTEYVAIVPRTAGSPSPPPSPPNARIERKYMRVFPFAREARERERRQSASARRFAVLGADRLIASARTAR